MYIFGRENRVLLFKQLLYEQIFFIVQLIAFKKCRFAFRALGFILHRFFTVEAK